MEVFIQIVVLIVAVALIIIVLSQEGKDAGFGSALSGQTDTYWSKNKGRSKEGMLVKVTTCLLVLLLGMSLLLSSKLMNGKTVTDSGEQEIEVSSGDDDAADDGDADGAEVEVEADGDDAEDGDDADAEEKDAE